MEHHVPEVSNRVSLEQRLIGGLLERSAFFMYGVSRHVPRFIRYLPFCAMLVFGGVSAFAEVLVTPADYTGSRSSNNNAEITSCCAWDLANGFQINWVISDLGGGLWQYNYSFTVPQGDVSHWIMETSSSFTRSNVLSSSGASISSEGVANFGTHPSNPGIPGSIFGIKWEGNKGTVSFTSDRVPIWGDFYAKDGSAGGMGENFAHNTGFGTDPTAATTSFAAWIPTPDTVNGVVPEPSSVLLLASVLAGVGLKLRSRLKATRS